MAMLRFIGGTILVVVTWFLVMCAVLILPEPANATPQCDTRDRVMAIPADGQMCLLASGTDFSGVPNA